MFIPKKFLIEDWEEIKQFIKTYSFAIIVSFQKNKPIATHIPVQLRKLDGSYYITGHLAKANSQWKTFNDEINNQVLIIFSGPHAYVSSSWYSHENVPTWNYQAVHIYGKVLLMDERELVKDLQLLLEKYEKVRNKPVLWNNLSDQTKQQMKGIVGFKVKVEDVQAAYKLSQNRNEVDYDAIIKKLNSEKDAQARQIAKEMKRIK